MTFREEPCRNHRLLDRFVEQLGLRTAAARACEALGEPERSAQVEYCLAVLALKHASPRSRGGGPKAQDRRLDPDAADIHERIDCWAQTIAQHLRDGGEAYEQIRAEADDFDTTTIRRLLVIQRPEDVVDVVADELSDVLLAGPALDEMSLELARAHPVGGNDYVFQSPLGQWLGTSLRRRLPWDADDVDDHREEIVGGASTDQEAEIEAMNAQSQAIFDALVAWVAGLAETRGTLSEALEVAALAETGLEQAGPSRDHDRRLLAEIRASLLMVAEELHDERRAVPDVAAYVVLAMRDALVRQRVAILSLRVERLERLVVDAIAAALRGALTDARQPTPRLMERTSGAATLVPGSRVKALKAVRDAGERRADELAPTARTLAELPPTVPDLDTIGALANASKTAVSTHRNGAANELHAIDAAYGRLFKRYAMGRP